ncbi:hypothetical protein GCM10007933_21470 [Zoogloea oryzae]|uniref:Mu-like prophage FluMu N-terminal domain-containing protein n=1 Tax=Zoogloea oryzae TaxID=310767 RepID=A0ABQ6FAX1_9RHOO|nr:hypothetical protein [Zoogloea oryzae]GLT22687.1 hypothetical protein GCM10007933_21470 [Zoogloea oryzae]
MSNVYVRIAKKGVENFHRCGEQFTGAWRLLEGVDDATLKRLREEQMLEVSDTKPEGFEPTAEGGAALQLTASTGTLSDLEREILAIVGTRLDTGTLDDIFDSISEHSAVTHRADGDLLIMLTHQRDNAEAECARLAGLLEQSVLEAGKLAEENAALRAQLAALNNPATAAAPVEALASTGEDAVERDVVAAVDVRIDDAIAKGDAALAKLGAAIDKLAEGAPAEPEATTKKARK